VVDFVVDWVYCFDFLFGRVIEYLVFVLFVGEEWVGVVVVYCDDDVVVLYCFGCEYFW